MSVVGVTIGIGKIDGTEWDGLGRVSDAERFGIVEAVSAPGSQAKEAAVGALLAMRASDGIAKPDPYGFVEVYAGGDLVNRQAMATRELPERDTFTPMWRQPPTWRHVTILPNLRLRVSVWDRDLQNDDAIGTAELNSNDLNQALYAGGIYEVNVANQTANQLLLVGLSVVAEN